MANQWLRLWHDMPTDPKWRTIAKASGQRIGDVMAVYCHLLVCASNATERGRTQSFNCEDVASAIDVETEQVAAIVDAMQGRVLDGDQVKGWEKRQVAREDGAAERAKAWREAKKAEPNATERNRTQGERDRTPDKDKDTDKDTEKRREEKEIPSEALASGAEAPQSNPADEIFGRGLPALTAAGCPEKNARSMLGLMRKTHGDDAVIRALADMAKERPLEPVAWLQAALRPRAKPAGSHTGFASKNYRDGVTEDGSIAA